jgi:hypothetical protein
LFNERGSEQYTMRSHEAGSSLPDPTEERWMGRIRGEYLDMPWLSVTAAQGQRLWGVDPTSCRLALGGLLANGFLRRTSDGLYVRASAPARATLSAARVGQTLAGKPAPRRRSPSVTTRR